MEICPQTMGNYQEVLNLARWSEAHGLACFSLADHYQAGVDGALVVDQLAVLAGLARETKTIELASLVSPISFRHPAVMLKMALAIDQMSDGRFSLGVGTGWLQEEHDAYGLTLPPMDERFDRLEEALAYLHAAMAFEPTGFEGRHYRLEPLAEPPPKNLRLIVGGEGRVRTPDLAGRFAHEFNVNLGKNLEERIARAHRAAADVGRTLLISTLFPPLIGRDRADYRDRLETVARIRGREPDALEARAAEVGVPHGPIDQAKGRINELKEMGITRVHLQVYGLDTTEVARAVEVLMG